MTNDLDDPVIINSNFSRDFSRDGISVEVHIYRLENSGWVLEVVDKDKNSIVWDEEFATDHAANHEFLNAVELEGLEGILRDPKIQH